MILYAVFRQGVYRHQCGGLFSNMTLAVATADNLAAIDSDDYHAYEVIPFELDLPTPTKRAIGCFYSPDVIESTPVYKKRQDRPGEWPRGTIK